MSLERSELLFAGHKYFVLAAGTELRIADLVAEIVV
jgi:hypothetical protein